MNNPDPRQPWFRLAAAARQAPEEPDASAPYGFATRVAALAYAGPAAVGSLLERFAFRAVVLSGLLALLSVAVNYQALTTAPARPADDFALLTDPVALALDFAD